ncbi:L,D-transpeptidase, partial [Rhizobiaceae sp. 2RAB30]
MPRNSSPRSNHIPLSEDHPHPNRRTALLGLGAVSLTGLAACTRTLDIPSLQLDDVTTGAIRPKISVDRQVT